MAIGDSTRVNTNIAAFNALNALKNINRSLELKSGLIAGYNKFYAINIVDYCCNSAL